MAKNNVTRWLARIIILLAVVLGTIFVLGYFLGGTLVKHYLEARYPITMDSVSLSINENRLFTAEVNGLAAKDKSLFAKHVTVRSNPWDVLSGNIAELQTEGIIVVPKLDPQTPLEFPDLESLIKQSPVHIQQLAINDVSLHIPANDVIAEELTFKGAINGNLTTLADTKLNIEANVPVTAHSKGGNLTLKLDKGVLTLKAAVSGVNIMPMSVPYNLSLDATRVPGQPINFSGKITDISDALWIEVAGAVKDPAEGHLTFKIPSRQINKQNLPLQQLGLDFLASITDYNFNVKGEGTITWNPKEVKPTGKIEVTEGNMATEKVSLTGLQFKLPLEQVIPVVHIKQDIIIDSFISPVTEMKDLRLSVDLNQERAILAQVSCQAWNGHIYLSKLVLYPLPPEQICNLTFEAVSLDVLVTHLNLKNMKASGRLSGLVPLQIFEDSSIAVKDGSLKSSEPGELAYQWDDALASSNQSLHLAGLAIQNFKYEEVDIRVNKNRHEEPVLELDIKGKNPKLLEGRSFDIRINLSGKLLEALESMIRTFQADINDLKQRAKSGK